MRQGGRRGFEAEPRVRPRFSAFSTGVHYHRDLDSDALPERLRVVMEALGSPGRALDVGCHTGFMCQELQRRGWETQGLEANVDAAEVARSSNIPVAVGSVEDPATWELVGNRFDVILLLDILEHTYDPWSVLEMARSHLQPHGRVLITLPNVACWKVLRELVQRRQFVPPSTGLDDPTHIRFFTLRDAIDLLRSAGYEPLRLLPAWTCVPGSHRMRNAPSSFNRLWTKGWIRWAPSFAIAVPLLVAEPAG